MPLLQSSPDLATNPVMTSSATEIASPIVRVPRQIELRGVRVHNLRGVDLDIPLGQLVVLSGVSGSGKSSLAFDTIFAEGQRRYIESFSASARQYLERIERPNADRIAHVPPAVALRTDSATRPFTSRATVGSLAEIDSGFRRLFARLGRVICPACGCDVRSNSAQDIVQTFRGLTAGTRVQLCFRPTVEDGPNGPGVWLARGFSRAILHGQSKSLDELPDSIGIDAAWIVADRLVAGKATNERVAESADSALREGNGRCLMLLDSISTSVATAGISLQTCSIDERAWQVARFSRHWECASCRREFLPPEIRLFDPGFGRGCAACRDVTLANGSECGECHGSRLSPEALALRIGGQNLANVLQRTVDQATELCRSFSRDLSPSDLSLSNLIREDIQRRLGFVSELGLGHLILQRPAQSLSGGQSRRLMLSAAIGSRITGTLCLVDEPSAGLHPSEIPLVIRALRRLLEQHNSVIVVDHSPEIIRAADHVIDLGPGAGPLGGTVAFSGPPARLFDVEESATGRALRSRLNPPTTLRSPRQATGWLMLNNIQHRNLRDLTVRFPLGVLCVVSGPGGCGKSSLVAEVLVPGLRNRFDSTSDPMVKDRCSEIRGGDSLTDVAIVDRTPLTRSSRSNAATWIEVFDEIREVFALTAEARQRGFGPQHFSFNAAQGGRCRACRGTGVLRHDMQFMPDVTLACPECNGTRYRREILDVKYKGRNIAEVLSMSAAEAATFFRNHPRLQARFQMLKQIGLEYLVLGQSTDTLSGGEAQRLKLAARLTSSRGSTLIVCDEATVGLHPSDVTRLSACFDELLGIGHSIVVIDNNPELLQAADYVIELGPGSGEDGGRIVSEGPRS